VNYISFINLLRKKTVILVISVLFLSSAAIGCNNGTKTNQTNTDANVNQKVNHCAD
jgi:hypothetical protein